MSLEDWKKPYLIMFVKTENEVPLQSHYLGMGQSPHSRR
jgi:hypothetical protein